MSFIGGYTFEIKNSDTVNVINTLRASSIRYKNLSCNDTSLSGEIPFYQLKKLKKICEYNSFMVNVLSSSKITHLISVNHKRKGILFGIFISFILLFYLSNIILKVNITGCDEKTKSQIETFIFSSRIDYGDIIPLIDFQKLEADIYNTFDCVSFVDISSYNSALNINVSIVTPHDSIIPDNHHPSDIISTKDAQIVKVNVSSGQLVSLVGSGVKKGDLLVSGIVDNKKGEYMYYHSIAQIWGKYEETVIFEQPLNECTEIITDIDLTDRSISYFDIEIPIDRSKRKSNYYIKEETRNNIVFLGIDLPISVIDRMYYISSFINTEYSVDEAKLRIENRIKNYEQTILSSAEIVSKYVDEFLSDECVRYEVTYTLVDEIGMQKEIMLK